jgi:selenocysteine-specific elongation factor
MKHIIIGTAGHIDHGKTSLIKMLTGIDCDTHKEEKARGITINLGFSHIDLPSGVSAGIIDVPGHKDFINTMVGGACGIDLVLLVIAADSGMMPQTIEHINIITALGINKGVVALTKTDLVDDELAEMAQYEITDYLKSTSLKNVPVVGVSAQTGKGKDELTAAIDKQVAEIEEKERESIFRMYIDRIFTVKGFGCVVTGSVLSGSVSVGNDVFLLPGDRQKLRVRSIERHGRAVEQVEKGDRAAINLIGLKQDDFQRGMLLSNRVLETTEMVDAYITTFDNSSELTLWSHVTFISGTFECQAKMHLLNKDIVAGGQDGIMQLHLSKPAVLKNRDRFIIRTSSADMTIGGGFIIDSSPLHHRKRSTGLTETLESLCINILTDAGTSENIGMLLNREFRPFTIDEVSSKLGKTKDEVQNEIRENQGMFVVYENSSNSVFISEKCESSIQTKILRSLEEHHDKNPVLPEGLETGELMGKLGLSKVKTGKIYLELLLEKLKDKNLTDRYKSTWIIKGHVPDLMKKRFRKLNGWKKRSLISVMKNL